MFMGSVLYFAAQKKDKVFCLLYLCYYIIANILSQQGYMPQVMHLLFRSFSWPGFFTIIDYNAINIASCWIFIKKIFLVKFRAWIFRI